MIYIIFYLVCIFYSCVSSVGASHNILGWNQDDDSQMGDYTGYSGSGATPSFETPTPCDGRPMSQEGFPSENAEDLASQERVDLSKETFIENNKGNVLKKPRKKRKATSSATKRPPLIWPGRVTPAADSALAINQDNQTSDGTHSLDRPAQNPDAMMLAHDLPAIGPHQQSVQLPAPLSSPPIPSFSLLLPDTTKITPLPLSPLIIECLKDRGPIVWGVMPTGIPRTPQGLITLGFGPERMIMLGWVALMPGTPPTPCLYLTPFYDVSAAIVLPHRQANYHD